MANEVGGNTKKEKKKVVFHNPKGENVSKKESDQLCPGYRARQRLKNFYCI